MRFPAFELPAVRRLLPELFDSLPLGVLVVEPSLGTFANKEAVRLLELPDAHLGPGELGYLVSFRSKSGDVLPREKNPVVQALAGKSCRRERLEVHHRNGKRMRVALDAQPLPTDSRAALVFFEDLLWIEDETAEREQWTAVFGHEMRASLQSLLLASSMVMRESVTAKAKGYVEAISRNATLLTRLVQDVVDAGVVGSGALTVVKSVLPLGPFLANAVATSGLPGPTHPLKLSVESRAQVYADPDRLQQIVTNLLENAEKYSAPGALELGAFDRDGQVVVFLRDEGPGISAEQQEKLFARYGRLPSRQKGLGLGLWLCRELARQMGGEMWLSSAEGGRTTFFLALPRADAAAKGLSEGAPLALSLPD